MKTSLKITSLVLVSLLAGCQSTKPLYHYGKYQSGLYEHFKAEDNAVGQQIDDLTKTIAKAEQNKLKVAPGIHAHLGYLYLKTGQNDLGFQHLNQEKVLFPESAAYIDFLLKNAKAVATSKGASS